MFYKCKSLSYKYKIISYILNISHNFECPINISLCPINIRL